MDAMKHKSRGMVVWDDHHKECSEGCVSLRIDGFTISMTNYTPMPEIMVFAASGEDSEAFTLTEYGLRQALAWIDKRREEQ